MSKDALSTILSFRISKEAKAALLKKADELTIQESYKFSVSELIKIAIEKTWDIKCID